MRPRVLVLCVLALVAASVLGLSLASRRAPPSGLVEGRLRPLPATPNAVSSQGDDPERTVAPLQVLGDPQEAFARVLGIVESWPRVQRLALDERYAHFEVTTPLLRFHDDLELLLDAEEGVIHVRSASRVGYGDLGANRARVERLREEYRTR